MKSFPITINKYTCGHISINAHKSRKKRWVPGKEIEILFDKPCKHCRAGYPKIGDARSIMATKRLQLLKESRNGKSI